MKLVTFSDDSGTGLGVLSSGGGIADLRSADGVPATMIELIAGGEAALSAAREAAATVPVVEASKATLLAPIPVPARNIFCVGKNYRDHIGEVRGTSDGAPQVPQHPVIFTKSPACVIGPGAEIQGHLDSTGSVDYEAEIAVIIGRPGRGIAAADAFGHVFGYTLFNDVTARTLQTRHGQWFIGKSIDSFGPMGPCIVTQDEIGDIGALEFTLAVNGETRQRGKVADMIFDIATVIETLSRTMRLEPGDVIATGTPAGVGMGFSPPRFLKKGDRVEIASPSIGSLVNTVR